MTRKSYEPYCAKFDGPLKRRDRIKNLPVDGAVHEIRDNLGAPKSSLVGSTGGPSGEPGGNHPSEKSLSPRLNCRAGRRILRRRCSRRCSSRKTRRNYCWFRKPRKV